MDIKILQEFEEKINSTLRKFDKKTNTCACYQEIKNIQADVDKYLLQHERPDKKDLIETMSRICSRLNENEIIDSLNQQFMHKASQKHSSIQSYVNPSVNQQEDEVDEIQPEEKNQPAMQKNNSGETALAYKNHQARYKDVPSNAPSNPVPIRASLNNKTAISEKIAQRTSLNSKLPGNPGNLSEATKTAQIDQESKTDFTIIIEKAEKHIKEIKEFNEQRNILEANKRLLKIEHLLSEGEQLELTEEQTNTLKEFKTSHSDLIENLKDETDLINFSQEIFDTEENWTESKGDSGHNKIKVSVQLTSSTNVSACVEGEVPYSVGQLSVLITQPENLKQCVPQLEQLQMIKQINHATTQSIATLESKQGLNIYATSFDNLNQYGSVLSVIKPTAVESSSPKKNRNNNSGSKSDSQGLSGDQQSANSITIDSKYLIIRLNAVSSSRTLMTIAVNSQSKVSSANTQILQGCAKKFAVGLFEKLISQVSQVNQAQIEESPYVKHLNQEAQGLFSLAGITNDQEDSLKCREKITAAIHKKKLLAAEEEAAKHNK